MTQIDPPLPYGRSSVYDPAMRIIAGKWRSRRLERPETELTRPMPDRVKEMVFNKLGVHYGCPGLLPSIRVADVFAGSGSNGLEALSRGAEHCIFFERDRQALDTLGRNIAVLDAEADSTVVVGDAWQRAIESLGGNAIELMFLDPPYADLRNAGPHRGPLPRGDAVRRSELGVARTEVRGSLRPHSAERERRNAESEGAVHSFLRRAAERVSWPMLIVLHHPADVSFGDSDPGDRAQTGAGAGSCELTLDASRKGEQFAAREPRGLGPWRIRDARVVGTNGITFFEL